MRKTQKNFKAMTSPSAGPSKARSNIQPNFENIFNVQAQSTFFSTA